MGGRPAYHGPYLRRDGVTRVTGRRDTSFVVSVTRRGAERADAGAGREQSHAESPSSPWHGRCFARGHAATPSHGDRLRGAAGRLFSAGARLWRGRGRV